MTLLTPLGLLAGLLVVPILALHILKARRTQVRVTSTMLWEGLARPVAPSRPWQRLRLSLPLLFQLLAVALVATALAQPALERRVPFARHTVFMVDVSASMGARDGAPDRVGQAVKTVSALRRKLPDGARASLIAVDAHPRVLLSTSESATEFADALRVLRATSGPADIANAAALSQGLQSAEADTGFVFVSDGRVDPELARLLPSGTLFEPIGRDNLNRAVTHLTVETRGSGLHARVTVRNTGGPSARPTLRVDVDGRTAFRTELDLAAGATVVTEADLPLGTRVTALLDQVGGQADLLDLDDRAYAVVEKAREIRTLVVGPADDASIFIVRALQAIPHVVVERSRNWPTNLGPYDVAVADRTDPPSGPTARNSLPLLLIAPPSGYAGVKVGGTVKDPAITLVRTDDPALVGLDLADVVVAAAQQVVAADADVLVAASGAPLLLRGFSNRIPYDYLAFEPEQSTLPLDLAWPVLIDRLVAELSASEASSASLEVGATPDLPLGRNVVVTAPDGETMTVAAGGAAPALDAPGFWTIRADKEPADASAVAGTVSSAAADDAAALRTIAVNPPPSESVLRPEATMPIERLPARSVGPGGIASRTFFPWIIGALMAVLLAEWLAARRGVGVLLRQWRAAEMLRLVVAILALLALFAPIVQRTTNEVATVFVVDASDSLGPAGRAEAVRFVEKALADAPRDARAGVVVFGGTARVAAAVRIRASLSGASVPIDAQRTDLAGALRLAAAVAPRDAARRIVLVSDGRRTQGNETQAAAELAAAGIRLDVVPIGSKRGTDVAVTSIDAPQRARVGEKVTIRTTLTSSAPVGSPAQEVPFVVRADGRVVEQRTVTLTPGSSVVEVPIVVSGAGVVRYEVEAGTGSDAVPQNDLGFAAVSVEGAARVIVVAGTSDGTNTAADAVVRALSAGGLVVERRSVSEFPSLEELVGTAGLVMVNVSARELSAVQQAGLAASVRQLGVGLTVIGGDHSFGTGGYLGSDLEQILPVVSEVLDPKRRKTVAQVLAIDTSGSMAACHCAEPGNLQAPRNDGGIVKTDIARSAAAAAIDSLNSSDEIGVLSISSNKKWVLELGPTPSDAAAGNALRALVPNGETKLLGSLRFSADRLKKSKAALKHIVLFTDGFTPTGNFAALIEEARQLHAEGITVSVVGTGEGAAEDLQAVAKAGGGRFYAGRNLTEIPRIFVEESQVVARSLINEGRFVPEITASAAPVRELDSAPALLGFQATTAKPTARTFLRIGPEHDPLAATWQTGLGRVTVWTSDGGSRWAADWFAWDGAASFWTNLVKDTFALGGPGQVQARLQADQLEVRAVADGSWPDGATATASVRLPDGTVRTVDLERGSDNAFGAVVEAPLAGTYSVGASVETAAGPIFGGGAIANRGYSAEYRPGDTEARRLVALSETTGGRGSITENQAFDPAQLIPGRRDFRLRVPLLCAAALGFVLACVLWRIPVRRRRSSTFEPTAAVVTARPSGTEPVGGGTLRNSSGIQATTTQGDSNAGAEPPAAETSLERMLARTRRSRDGAQR